MCKDTGIKLIQFKIQNAFFGHLHVYTDLVLRRQRNAGSVRIHHRWAHAHQLMGIVRYWEQVHKCILEMTSVDFPFCPRLYILGDPKQVARCDYADLIRTIIMIGRQVLVRGWKTAGSPSFQECFVEIGKVCVHLLGNNLQEV